MRKTVTRPDTDVPAGDAIVYAQALYPIESAIPLGEAPSRLPRVDVNLSDWLIVRSGALRHLCISSNFGGIGRSGVHQRVRFGYLLSLTRPRVLYWVAGSPTPAPLRWLPNEQR
jgi:hypothetical protein